jgi:hypothetical protein
MATIVTRAVKGEPLTHAEVDSNFGNINTDLESVESEVVAARGSRSNLGLRITNISNFASPNALGYVVGGWRTNGFHGTNLGTISGAINRLELSPFYTSEPLRVDSVGFSVTTASSTGGGEARALIYEDDGDGFPGDLVYAGPALSTTSTGARQDGAADITFEAGRQYWLGLHWNSAATVRGINVNSAVNLGLSGNHTNTHFNKLRTTPAFGSHLATYSFAIGHRQTGSPPAIIMRAAALS